MRSSSPLSKDTQAAEKGAYSSQVLNTVVLPKPAGAAMSVNGRWMPSWSWFVRRGRATRSERTGGMASFVTRSNRSPVRPFVSSNEAGVFCICSPTLLSGNLRFSSPESGINEVIQGRVSDGEVDAEGLSGQALRLLDVCPELFRCSETCAADLPQST